MPVYVPDETLPIYPAISTTVKNGIKYKVYYETDWHQVITEDGVPLCVLLQSMPQLSGDRTYKYCGVLKNVPGQTGTQRLYDLTSQKIGDVYLVETDKVFDGKHVYDTYVWLGNEYGWFFCGTNTRNTISDLPDYMKQLPAEIGDVGNVLVVSADGRTMEWDDPIANHNLDEHSHEDIRDKVELKADKLIILSDALKPEDWVYNSRHGYYEYLYTSPKLPLNSYFDITPVINNDNDENTLRHAGIKPVYEIKYSNSGTPYATLLCKSVPLDNILICVKVFGTYNKAM